MTGGPDILETLRARFGPDAFSIQETCDGIPTLWVSRARVREALAFLKREIERPYRMLFDLTAVDERARRNRADAPLADFTLVYHLASFERNADVRLKVALQGMFPSAASVTDLWPAASWYEREIWDMFGIRFEGHPNLRRLLMPRTWNGHPLRKEHPARATELPPFCLDDARRRQDEEALRFRPEDWGLATGRGDTEFLFLNLGPQHPGAHGVLRLVLQLDGEEILEVVPDIGFHHRGVEKMGERQSWHTFLPYTDRVDYLAGVLNEFPYVLAVERLAGIEVPERAQVLRVLGAELFRIASHLVWYGTFAQDVGQLSPVFYMFTDREEIFDLVEALCGARMHPAWFRIGGVAQDVPQGWTDRVRDFVRRMPARLREYDGMVLRNRIFQARTKGIGAYRLEEAVEWGVTGPGLRACGLAWDLRRCRPYSGYDRYEFEIPVGVRGDGYDRARVRVEEMRQSLRIIEQCLRDLPPGPILADHPLACPPPKERTLRDIETLIAHFLNVSWGPVLPPGEAARPTEGSKGIQSYYVISDGGPIPYRVRTRMPSFAHIQMVPHISRGHLVSDLLSILGSIDFVLGEVDR